MIALPVFQRFDCHSCGYCCRHLVVTIDQGQRQAILQAGWERRIPDHPLFERYRLGGRRGWQLAHRPDGRCVFLGDDERCRLHAESGPQLKGPPNRMSPARGLKPLACRLYPFVPTPAPGGVAADLRFDCPSVAANRGRSCVAHRHEVAELSRQIGAVPLSRPPPWPGAGPLEEAELRALVAAFDGLLQRSALARRARLRACCGLLESLCQARVRRVRGPRWAELLSLLADEAAGAATRPVMTPVPTRAGRLFRQWLFLHAVADEPADLRAGPLGRLQRSWRRYRQARRFVACRGLVPQVAGDWPVTSFEAVDAVQPAQDDDLEPLCRAMRVKLQAYAFAGPAYYRYDLAAGLTALVLMPAVAGWLARLEAVGGGRDRINSQDLLAGLRRTHHTFGVSPAFARLSERWRMRALARPGVPFALLGAYGP
ncbi:MAG: YkgJ family cysteine cluster protein [Rhodocyclaceae bacterium]|nr:YkgJ family cysteine cluster protein [Rhodocyclaceae bacterium]